MSAVLFQFGGFVGMQRLLRLRSDHPRATKEEFKSSHTVAEDTGRIDTEGKANLDIKPQIG